MFSFEADFLVYHIFSPFSLNIDYLFKLYVFFETNEKGMAPSDGGVVRVWFAKIFLHFFLIWNEHKIWNGIFRSIVKIDHFIGDFWYSFRQPVYLYGLSLMATPCQPYCRRKIIKTIQGNGFNESFVRWTCRISCQSYAISWLFKNIYHRIKCG